MRRGVTLQWHLQFVLYYSYVLCASTIRSNLSLQYLAQCINQVGTEKKLLVELVNKSANQFLVLWANSPFLARIIKHLVSIRVTLIYQMIKL